MHWNISNPGVYQRLFWNHELYDIRNRASKFRFTILKPKFNNRILRYACMSQIFTSHLAYAHRYVAKGRVCSRVSDALWKLAASIFFGRVEGRGGREGGRGETTDVRRRWRHVTIPHARIVSTGPDWVKIEGFRSSAGLEESILYLKVLAWIFVHSRSRDCYTLSFPVAQQPHWGQDRLTIEVSASPSDTPQSVGLLWTSDRPVAETSTWQHKTLTKDIHLCPSAWFEPSVPASERPLGLALNIN